VPIAGLFSALCTLSSNTFLILLLPYGAVFWRASTSRARRRTRGPRYASLCALWHQRCAAQTLNTHSFIAAPFFSFLRFGFYVAVNFFFFASHFFHVSILLPHMSALFKFTPTQSSFHSFVSFLFRPVSRFAPFCSFCDDAHATTRWVECVPHLPLDRYSPTDDRRRHR
jgi:hypothetical protein